MSTLCSPQALGFLNPVVSRTRRLTNLECGAARFMAQYGMHDNLPLQHFVEMDAFFSEDILQLLLEPADSTSSNLDVNALLLAALESYKDKHDTEAVLQPVLSAAETSHSHFSISSTSASGTQPCATPATPRFAQPKTDKEIVQARAEGVPVKTQQDTKYCVGLREEWREHRNQATAANIAPLTQLNHSKLQHWLTRFVLEVRMKKGEEFPPNHICCGIMKHLRWNGQPSIDLFADSDFDNFKATLDPR